MYRFQKTLYHRYLKYTFVIKYNIVKKQIRVYVLILCPYYKLLIIRVVYKQIQNLSLLRDTSVVICPRSIIIK